MSDEEPSPSLHLQLGDIIRLQSPADPDSHNKVYLVKYLDNNILRLSNVDGVQEMSIPIKNGKFSDSGQSITQIEVLDRPEHAGFARQNNLLPGTWIDLHFGGDVPTIFTGEVSDLEEDMVEIKTVPDGERIYIDFAYKGVPADLPLEKIVIREKPSAAEQSPKEPVMVDEEVPDSEEGEQGSMESVEEPVTQVKAQLREMLLDAQSDSIRGRARSSDASGRGSRRATAIRYRQANRRPSG